MESAARREAAEGLTIRPLSLADVDEVAELEGSIFSFPWSRSSFERECREESSSSWVARRGGSLVGYIVSWIACDEVHIGNVAVAADRRREGVGRRLVARVLDDARERGAALATLEARETNAPALGLYRGFGFKPVAMRKRYYADTGEDAIVMIADLTNEPG
ncbi:MAG: ribosomal-protein-alanine N-acetyltransferase [Candidatus Eisenbacteria bacterium]|nr:ribosomal-protein-alanine N-acetyltransferase [Candidatus Eisenbacteria bacterium]